MTVHKNDCLILEQGGTIDTRSPEVMAHLAQCADCRAFVAALSHLDALSDDGNTGPMAPLDDIARRRMLSAIVDASLAHAPERTDGVSPSRWILVAVAAALVIGFAAFYFVATKPSAIAPVVPGVVSESGTIALITGQADGLRVGAAVREKDVISTASAQSVVSLPTGVKVALGENTRLRFTHLNSEAMRVDLDVGSLLIVATPGRKGPKFVIGTADGDVTITGTALTVSKVDNGFEVRVLRGTVEVKSPKVSGIRRLKLNQVSLVGRPEVTDAPDTVSTLQAMVPSMELISTEMPSALSIDSTPSGATVSLDGVVLGRTPLEAGIRPGHRQLDISLDGYAPVSEMGSFTASETFSRTYLLKKDTREETGVVSPKISSKPRTVLEKQVVKRSAAEMLKDAQRLRTARDWNGSAAAYRALISTWPSTGEARNSSISLGQIELRQLGRPAAALEQFDNYLRAGAGPLGQEALLGKADALGALGRTAEEKTVLQEFLDRYPNALQARKVEERLNHR